jgi:hypothetical protein
MVYTHGMRLRTRGESWALCLIGRSNAGVVGRDDHPHATSHRRQRRDSARLGPRALTPLSAGSASRNSWTRTLGAFHAARVGRSRAIPYSHHGVERETRLELATLTLARYRFNFVFGRGQKWPQNHYLPPISTGVHADRTGIHAEHTAVHADHKTA